MNENIRMVSFKMDKQLWEVFKKVCKKNDSDSSKELRKMIKNYVNDNKELVEKLF